MESLKVTRRKRKKARFGLERAAALACAAIVLVLIFGVSSCVREPVLTLAGERAKALAANTMSYAVMAALERERGDMLKVTGGEGETRFVMADTAKINAVAALASADARERMESLGREGFTLSLGDISGLVLLGGIGPKIKVGFTPVGSVTADAVSSLRSAGINQCVYSVDLKLTAHIQIVLGGRAQTVEVTGVNPICQTVIVGEVPQVYTNVANEEDMLNLIPTDLP